MLLLVVPVVGPAPPPYRVVVIVVLVVEVPRQRTATKRALAHTSKQSWRRVIESREAVTDPSARPRCRITFASDRVETARGLPFLAKHIVLRR
jgi:hypothetical protein